MKAATGTISNKGMGRYKVSRVITIYLPPHCSHKVQPLDKAFKGPQKHSIAKKFKNCSIQTQCESSPSTKLANYSENTSKMQQAQQLLMADRQQALVT
jgi:hypothetical protein